MDVSNPMSCVVPSAHGPVLAVLAGTTIPLTGRGIAELTRPRVSQPRVARILRELTAAGLVERTPAGSSSLFVLNREHLAAGAVESLATLRQQLWARIAEHARTWGHRPVAVVVYGSAARGDGTIDSEIDLLVVRPMDVDDDDEEWQHDLTDLASHVARWTGNPCEILDRSEHGLATMAANGELLLTGIRRDGRALVGSLQTVPVPVEVA
ncbi:nucleotidyltransferase domain-containing protein [Pengzhenrongella sp.]|jgi:predicted nucleotidyltransferase|uniref:nucleotidyltransferase domain-containing protein n=1 Tax=Pengzhenrongella sp. TaxID=2888820 RepID=UPI002F931179